MSASPFVIWDASAEGNACIIRGIANVPDDWELQEGVPRAGSFPADAEARMDPDYPRLIGLTDNLRNSSYVVLASLPLVKVLRSRALKNVEYLPIAVINHKRRPVGAPYFVVSPIHPQDCLDIKASNCTYNELVPTDIDWVERIVFDLGRIDPAVDLFRVKSFTHLVFARRSLADQLAASGLSGLSFKELSDYTGYAPR